MKHGIVFISFQALFSSITPRTDTIVTGIGPTFNFAISTSVHTSALQCNDFFSPHENSAHYCHIFVSPGGEIIMDS